MSAKGSKLRYGNRNYIFNTKFYKENLIEKRKVILSFKQCKQLLDKCNKNIADIIRDEIDGFKMPYSLGYIAVGKYIPTYHLIDWKKSNELGKHVYHLNLHTNGFAIKLYWFRVGRIFNTSFHETYVFAPYKTLSKATSEVFGTGKMIYSEWSVSDFVEKSRTQRLFSKKYQKELKD